MPSLKPASRPGVRRAESTGCMRPRPSRCRPPLPRWRPHLQPHHVIQSSGGPVVCPTLWIRPVRLFRTVRLPPNSSTLLPAPFPFPSILLSIGRGWKAPVRLRALRIKTCAMGFGGPGCLRVWCTPQVGIHRLGGGPASQRLHCLLLEPGLKGRNCPGDP